VAVIKNGGSSRISVKIIKVSSFLKTEYFEFIELSQNGVKLFVMESHYSAMSQNGLLWRG